MAGSGFASAASCHSGFWSSIRNNRSAPAMAMNAWFNWLPMTCTGSKNKLARKKNITRSPTSMCSQPCQRSAPNAPSSAIAPEEKLALQLQQRHEHRRRLRHAHVVFAVQVNQLAEEARVDLVPHKRLRHPDAAHRFGERGGDAAPGFLHLAQPAAHLAAGNFRSRSR